MLVRDLYSSILRFCADFAEEHSIQVVNFDAYADDEGLPQDDVIGMSSLSWEVNDQLVQASVMIGICTKDDTNLFTLMDLIAHLYEKLLPTMKIRILNADSGEEGGWLIVENGTKAMPIGGSMARPMQYIMVGLASTTYFTL